MDNGISKYYYSWQESKYVIVDRSNNNVVDEAKTFYEARNKETEWNEKDRKARGIKSNEIEIPFTHFSERNREKIEVISLKKHGTDTSNFPVVEAEPDTDCNPNYD